MKSRHLSFFKKCCIIWNIVIKNNFRSSVLNLFKFFSVSFAAKVPYKRTIIEVRLYKKICILKIWIFHLKICLIFAVHLIVLLPFYMSVSLEHQSQACNPVQFPEVSHFLHLGYFTSHQQFQCYSLLSEFSFPTEMAWNFSGFSCIWLSTNHFSSLRHSEIKVSFRVSMSLWL